MHDQPSVRELVEAVKNFVDHTAMPELGGRAAFHARIASNVLATILRDMEARKTNEENEKVRLISLLGVNPDLDLREMNAELRQRIHAGDITIQSADLLSHLKKTAIAQLKVDQPTYSALKKAIEEP